MSDVYWILGRGGLLGNALKDVVQTEHGEEFLPNTKLAWNDPEAIVLQLTNYVHEFAERVNGKRWKIFWAAGTGTMGSTEEQLAKETSTLSALLHALGHEPLLQNTEGIFVYASSAGAIYAGCKDDVITEESMTAPQNAYGRTKLHEESLLRVFAEEHPRIGLVLARITNLFGEGQSRGKKQGLISHIARCALRREPVNIFVPLDTIRDYIPVRDAAEMMVAVASECESGQTIVRILASEDPTSIARIIGTFTSMLKIPPRISTGTNMLSAAYPHRMCFRSLARTARKQTSLVQGIARVLQAERIRLMN